MTQATPTIGANKSGLTYRQEDNDGKKALLNHHKGSTAPTYKEAGMIWLDDAATPWLLKFYDGSDWITLGELHAGNNTFNPYYGAAAGRLLGHATDTGPANAYAVAPSPAVTAYTTGQIVTLKPANANTGSSTIAVNGLAAKNIKMPDGTNPPANALLTTGTYILVYDGTNFILTNPSVSAQSVLTARGSSIASASTTDIGAADSDYVEISGTTTITSLGSTTTRNHIWVKFQGALTLRHNATSLILPTGMNIVTAAGDRAEFVRISGSNWQCLDYVRASGAPLAGGAVDAQIFTSSGTWTKPASGTVAYIQVWGAGGGGSTNASGGGGGGGGYAERWVPFSALGSTETVTIGSGGSAGSPGSVGGNSSFGSFMTAYGGGGAHTQAGGGISGGAASTSSLTSGGGATNTVVGGSGVFGGGGGAGNTGNGGSSQYGGGGGSGSGVGGASARAGAGGNAGIAGTAPAGGGGRNAAGARGEVRVFVF